MDKGKRHHWSAIEETEKKHLSFSRSPAIVIAYLMRSYHVSLEQCLGHVVQARPCVIPNDGFLKQLILYDRYLVERRRQQQQQQQQQEAARAQAAATAPVVEVPMQHHPSVSPQLVEKPATSQYSSVSDSKATHISSIDSSSAALSSSASGRSSPSVHSIHVIPIQVSSDVPMPKKVNSSLSSFHFHSIGSLLQTEPITIQQVSVDDGAPSVEPSKGKSPTCDKPLPDPSVAPHASSSRKRSQPRATHPTKQFFTQETRSDSRDPSNQNGHLPRQSSVILTPQQWSLINNYTPDFYGSDQPMPTKYITEIYDRATNRFIPTTCCYWGPFVFIDWCLFACIYQYWSIEIIA